MYSMKISYIIYKTVATKKYKQVQGLYADIEQTMHHLGKNQQDKSKMYKIDLSPPTTQTAHVPVAADSS